MPNINDINCPMMLAIDIGTGTKDIMLFDPNKRFENNVKLVVPTPGLRIAKYIENTNRSITIAGRAIGGGKLARAIKNHVKKGFKVSITTEAALTIRNNIDDVKDLGIDIDNEIDNPDIFFDEIEISTYHSILNRLSIDVADLNLVGISVQDHGWQEHNESSRKKRFEYFLNLLSTEHTLKPFIFTETTVPIHFPRMVSAVKSVTNTYNSTKVIVLDTCISALLGCIYDRRVEALEGPTLFINYGNGHTMACVMDGLKIMAFFEHHTGMIKNKPEIMSEWMKRLTEGDLSYDEIYDDYGHGCHTFETYSYRKLAGIVVTGPRRHLAQKAGFNKYIEAAPGGDMMMTGPLGLVRAYSLLKEVK